MPSDFAEKSFRIKEEGGFFSRLVAKEASMANASSRVMYYGETSVGVPFTWESKPGTPKHPLSETSLPPLTPPPSYTSTSNKSKPNPRTKKIMSSAIFRALFAGSGGRVHVSPSSSSSHHWSSFSSSSSSSSLGYYSSSSPSFSATSSKLGICFRYKHRRSSSEFNRGFSGCSPFGNIKIVILKIVGHHGGSDY